ncbi:F-box/LRR-repeat protein 7-like [Lingula anatina]|uniref:F-box/LRR-repeat protein 7-like n=1 Tax=Lingula anatina TaxID=7574 RepID=A0A1S3IG22_LINAN|nr:F-box/LRR-repeat protein 7-like [Lingula anatina]|eukprot:XP_013397167.1 F-box/LRR-repeat protein 7-like [Lingula anatina]
MVRSLKDCCLQAIARNLNRISRVGRQLPHVHKELILKWLSDHDMLTDDYLPHITYHLFSANLKVINFYKCNQVTDHLLYQLSQSGCMLKHLTVHECNNVSDEGIKYITIDQEELEVLELRKLRFLTSYGLEVVRSNKLQKLDLKGCSYIDSRGKCRLFKKFTCIQYFS